MTTFKQRLWVEYPIPQSFSIWGGNGQDIQPIEDIDVIIDAALEELASDLLITEYVEATGIATQLPKSTVTVCSAMLTGSYPFQGNRLVKCTLDKSKNIAYLRYYPATITYQRKLVLEDLDTLTGDRLIYIKSYILWKMAFKEATILKAANFTIDNGQIDLSSLVEFMNLMEKRYNELKPEILIYSTVN